MTAVTRSKCLPGASGEFDIAVANHAYPLPVGASGWASQEIWNTVTGDRKRFFRSTKPPDAARATLNDPSAAPATMVDSLIEMMGALRPS